MSRELIASGSPLTLTDTNQDIGDHQSIRGKDKGTVYLKWDPIDATSVLDIALFTAHNKADATEFSQTNIKDTDVATGISTIRVETFRFISPGTAAIWVQLPFKLADALLQVKALESTNDGGTIDEAYVDLSNDGKQ